MLKRIHIKGYKSLRDVELDLPPLAVLFGPNAAGKSNFLDALQLLSGLATSRTLRDAFAPPYRGKPLESFSFGRDGLRGLLDRKQLRLSMEADIELSDALVDAVNGEIQQMRGSWPSPRGGGATDGRSALPPMIVRQRNLRYRIEVEMAPQSGELRLHDEHLGALTRNGRPKRIRPFLERHDDLILLRREGEQYQVRYGRTDCSVLSQPHYPPQHPHVLAARREFESCRFHYLEPGERMRSEDPVGEVRRIGPMGEGLAAFLNTLKSSAPKQFRASTRLSVTIDLTPRKSRSRSHAAFCAATSMRRIALFGEDRAHQLVVGALLRRLAEEQRVEVSLAWRQAYGGHGRMKHELNEYLRALRRHQERLPDLIVAATDANCNDRHSRHPTTIPFLRDAERWPKNRSGHRRFYQQAVGGRGFGHPADGTR